MSKEKIPIKYDVVSSKGFSFNSTTYNIQNKNNSFWATSTKIPNAEIELKFMPHILTQIEFSKTFITILYPYHFFLKY